MTRIVTLLTDFGWADPWVAAVKGVLYSEWTRWPAESSWPRIVDLSHDIPPGDVDAAAWFLENVAPGYPAGTIHLAVVDPGVGGDRPALALEAGGQIFVGPGNGLLSGMVQWGREFQGSGDLSVVRLDRSLYQREGSPGGVSNTFHGRDVFAPAVAHLAMGVPLKQVGIPVGDEALGTIAGQGFPAGRGAAGQSDRIRWIDRFGNAISDLKRQSAAGRLLETGREVEVAGHRIPGPVKAYVHAVAGAPFWYWGSAGTLEIALRDANAANSLGLHRGLALRVPGM